MANILRGRCNLLKALAKVGWCNARGGGRHGRAGILRRDSTPQVFPGNPDHGVLVLGHVHDQKGIGFFVVGSQRTPMTVSHGSLADPTPVVIQQDPRVVVLEGGNDALFEEGFVGRFLCPFPGVVSLGVVSVWMQKAIGKPREGPNAQSNVPDGLGVGSSPEGDLDTRSVVLVVHVQNVGLGGPRKGHVHRIFGQRELR